MTSAILLGVVRRTARPTDATPLAPISSLHDFLPVLGEILKTPLTDDYLRYLVLVVEPRADHLAVGESPEDHALR